MNRVFRWIQPLPLIAVILWGGVYPGAKLGLQEIPVMSFASLRLVIAAVVLLAASGQLFRPRIPRGYRISLFAAGLAQTMFQAFFVLSMDRTTAGNGAVLLTVAPLLVVVFQACVQRAPTSLSNWLGLAVGLLGVGFVVSAGGLSISDRHLVGDIFAILSAAGWAWYGLCLARVAKAIGSTAATGWTMAVAATLLLPASTTEIMRHNWGSVSTVGWAALLYGSIVGPVIAMALWGRSLEQLGPRQTMVYSYLEPVSAVVLAAILLSEPFGLAQAFGAALAFIGVWLAGSPTRSRDCLPSERTPRPNGS